MKKSWIILLLVVVVAIGLYWWQLIKQKEDESYGQPTSGSNGAGYDPDLTVPDGSIVDYVSDADPADTVLVRDTAVRLSESDEVHDEWIVYKRKSALK